MTVPSSKNAVIVRLAHIEGAKPFAYIDPKDNPMMTNCEAEERNKRALYLLQNEWGCGKIDIGEMVRLLRGDACTHEGGGA